MFTGIIEDIGTLKNVTAKQNNLNFEITTHLKDIGIDDSIACNGICLTVESVSNGVLTFTAVKETIEKTNAAQWIAGSAINLERTLLFNGRVDGHLVQGHVDGTGKCIHIQSEEGSHVFTFSFDKKFEALLIEKGSVCINGVSLTVFGLQENSFKVTIIPYTYSHTNFNSLKTGDLVNLEFDLLGKYFQRYLEIEKRNSQQPRH